MRKCVYRQGVGGVEVLGCLGIGAVEVSGQLWSPLPPVLVVVVSEGSHEGVIDNPQSHYTSYPLHTPPFPPYVPSVSSPAHPAQKHPDSARVREGATPPPAHPYTSLHYPTLPCPALPLSHLVDPRVSRVLVLRSSAFRGVGDWLDCLSRVRPNFNTIPSDCAVFQTTTVENSFPRKLGWRDSARVSEFQGSGFQG